MLGYRFLIMFFSLSLTVFSQRPSTEQTLHFYGRVNHWADSRTELKKELDMMEKMHVDGYMIELSGWGRWGHNKWEKSWLKHTAREYRWLLQQCRQRNILLFVSIVNDNMGLGKYGDKGPELEKVEQDALALVRIVKKGGSEGVFVQPVAETRTKAGHRLEQYCIQTLKGFTLVYNGSRGFPDKKPEGFTYRAVHPSAIKKDVPRDAFVVSDHGLIIRELTVDKSLNGIADGTKLKTWIEKLHRTHVPAIGYYGFQRTTIDSVAIKTLGK